MSVNDINIVITVKGRWCVFLFPVYCVVSWVQFSVQRQASGLHFRWTTIFNGSR